jgi:hypothetical protein
MKLGHSDYGNRERAFLSKVIWKIFGPNREEVAEGWRNLHNVDHLTYMLQLFSHN